MLRVHREKEGSPRIGGQAPHKDAREEGRGWRKLWAERWPVQGIEPKFAREEGRLQNQGEHAEVALRFT